MIKRNAAILMLAFGIVPYTGTIPQTLAQEMPTSDASDTLVDINEGIYYYLSGVSRRKEEPLQHAIELFSAALARNPRNQVALLFRALCHGQIGLIRREEGSVFYGKIKAREDATTFLNHPPEKLELMAKVAELELRLSDPALPPVERVALLTHKNDINQRLDNVAALRDFERLTLDEKEADNAKNRADLQEKAKGEREAYRLMVEDIQRLVDVLDSPEAMVRLLEVVAKTKIAGLLDQEAKRGEDLEVAPKDLSAPPPQLRRESADILAEVTRTLKRLLDDDVPQGPDVARTKFFYGVILYRRGVPLQDKEVTRSKNAALLRRAEDVMRDVANDETVGSTWRSFAALYLGLIIPFRAADATSLEDRAAQLDEATQWLQRAAELDVAKDEQGNPIQDEDGNYKSNSFFIPTLKRQQDEAIAGYRTMERVAMPDLNDISISFHAGAHRDTNVILLGGRTDLPRDISRKEDYGFSTGVSIGYAKDLSDRLTLGAEGRASSMWHADVDEFDEQNYGASLALQYELLEQRDGFGPVHFRLQYDYDYTLLGREGFLNSNRVTPNLRAFWDNRRAETNLYFTYDIRDYFEQLADRRTDRTGEYFSIGITQSYKTIDMTKLYQAWSWQPWGHHNDDAFRQEDPDYPKRYLTPFVGFQYAWDQTTGTEFDQKSYLLAFGAMIPLPWGVDMHASADFEWQEYQNGSVIDFHRRARRDLIQRYRLEFSRVFVLQEGQVENRYRPKFDRVTMTLRAHASWTLDDSNVVDRLGQSIFEYDRTLYGISVAFTVN